MAARVLIARPEPGASATALKLRELGHEAVLAPLFSIRMTMSARPRGPFDALIVTSGNGAAGLSPALAALNPMIPAFAVGARTAEVLRNNGFTNVRSADGDQGALAALIADSLQPGARLLAAVGEDRKPGLDDALSQAGFVVTPWIRYRAVAETRLPDTAREALTTGGVTHVLHYSRRGAEVFTALTRDIAPAGLTHLCLSPDVAGGLDAAKTDTVIVATHPDETSLLALLEADPAKVLLRPPEGLRDGAAQEARDQPDMAARGTPPDRAERDAAKAARAAKSSESTSAVEAAGTSAAEPAAPGAAHAPAGGAASEPLPAAGPQTADAGNATHLAEPTRVTVDRAGPAGAEQARPEEARPAQAQPEPAITAPVQTVVNKGYGGIALLATGVLAAAAGSVVTPFVQPWLERAGLVPSGPVATIAARVARLETIPAAAPAPGPVADPSVQQALRTVAEEAQRASRQVQTLEQRLSELGARPAPAPAPDPAIAQLREGLQRAEATALAASQTASQSAAAIAPRLQQLEAAARGIGTPSTAATATAKMVMAERLQRAIADGRPFETDLAALRNLGASADALQRLSGLAASGAPTMTVLTAAFRQARPGLVAEPAGTDLSLSDRLLRLTDGLVRVRATGAVEGTSPAALAARIEQALQRGDASAAAASWGQLPEPARRASQAFADQLRARAGADEAARSIMDDAVRALGQSR